MSNTRINFDYVATSPMLADAQQAMSAALAEAGNPSAVSQAGQRAKRSVEQARKHVAALINAKPAEISFTSCGTESNNWALRGLFNAHKRKAMAAGDAAGSQAGGSIEPHVDVSSAHGPTPTSTLRETSSSEEILAGDFRAMRRDASRRLGPIAGPAAPAHIIISAIEHPSVSLAAKRLGMDGAEVTILPVDREGFVSASDLKAALTPQTVLVSIMLANGEVGTIEPIQELAAIAHEHGALFHTDAVAAVGYLQVDVKQLGVDALSLAANQFYGPQGAAALFVREGVRILPLLEGGGQEHGGRSGTESVAAIVGMGLAAEIAKRELPHRIAHVSRLRDQLKEGLAARVEHVRFSGSWTSRLPDNLHVCVEGVSSESLVLGLDQAGVSVGLGSACNSKSMRPSHVLKAMGLSDEQAQGALVFTLGAMTTADEIDRALEIIPRVVEQLRRVTALTVRA